MLPCWPLQQRWADATAGARFHVLPAAAASSSTTQLVPVAIRARRPCHSPRLVPSPALASSLFLQLFSERRETDKRKKSSARPIDRTSQPATATASSSSLAWRGACRRPGTNATVGASVRACGAPLRSRALVLGHRAPMFPAPCREETPPQMPEAGRHGRVAMQCESVARAFRCSVTTTPAASPFVVVSL